MPRKRDQTGKAGKVAKAPKKSKISKPKAASKGADGRTKSNSTEMSLQLALKAARMGIWEWDIKTNAVRWSDNVHRMLGLTPKAFDGTLETYINLIHPLDRNDVIRKLEHALKTRQACDIEHRLVWLDGSVHWIGLVGNLTIDSHGRPVTMIGTIQEITKRKQVEFERQDWKTRYELIAASAGIVVYDYDVASGIIHWSGNVKETLGYNPDELGNIDRWVGLIHPQDREVAFELLEEAQANLTPYDFQYRFKKRSGEFCPMHDRGLFVANESGAAVRMLGMMTDVSEILRHKAGLIEHSRFRDSVENAMPGLLYLFDTIERKVTYANKSSITFLGYTPEELIDFGSDFVDKVIFEEDHPHITKWAKEPDGTVKETEIRILKKDGAIRWFITRDTPFKRDEKGKVIQIVGIAQDITSRRKADEALRESEQRFRMLQQASFGGIGLHDRGKILDCNQGLCDLTGYKHEELIGMNGLGLIAPEWRDFVMEKIVSGYDKTYDVEGLRKDGTRYFLEIRGKNIPFEGRTIRVTEFRDITERKRSEEKIIEQNSRLTALTEDLLRKNNQLEEFTQIVSHNLRSPVGNIVTLLSFYENASSDRDREELFSLLKESSTTTLNMLNDVNDVLKIKQNRNIEKQELRFDDVMQQVTAMLSAKISDTSAVVKSDFSQAPVIQYPAIYLESIFLNLLDNALKYAHPDRTPVIRFETSMSEKHLILTVSDNGLGINLKRYGHQMFKLRKTFHRHPESRGIGLFMIKNQIEAMGGEISVKSRENGGTTFFVNFNKNQPDG